MKILGFLSYLLDNPRISKFQRGTRLVRGTIKWHYRIWWIAKIICRMFLTKHSSFDVNVDTDSRRGVKAAVAVNNVVILYGLLYKSLNPSILVT